MILTAENYFSPEANRHYMGSSQFKSFMNCEAAAMAELKREYERPMTTALLIGTYIDAHYEGTLDIFRAKHPEIFTKSGELKAEYRHAEKIIARLERDRLFSSYMAGEKQVIMTGEIAGVPYKIKIDSYHPGKAIVDLKIIKDFDTIYNRKVGGRQHFIDFWRYDIQGAIYQEVVRQNTGLQLPFYIAAGTKQEEPDLNIFWVPQNKLDEALDIVTHLSQRFCKIKWNMLIPQSCEECAYCRFKKELTEIINYQDEIIDDVIDEMED